MHVFHSAIHRFLIFCIVLPGFALLCHACGAVNIGKWRGIDVTPKGEKFYLVKDVFLTSGSAYHRKELFDHTMNDSVNLYFSPKDERNRYVAESIWYDPTGVEFRTIRQTYDVKEENKTGEERPKGGTTRVHSMSTEEMAKHKPGMWKVALYLDGDLVRRLNFTVR
jgi:hypothetical protein